MLDLRFELGSQSRNGRNGTPPVGISAFTSAQLGERLVFAIAPDDTPRGLTLQFESSQGASVVCASDLAVF